MPQIAMKPPEFDPNSDRNWTWPEKTWFRERLNALRAREHETRQARRQPETIGGHRPNLVPTQEQKKLN